MAGVNRGREVSKGDYERVAREVGGNPGSTGSQRLREDFQQKAMEKRI